MGVLVEKKKKKKQKTPTTLLHGLPWLPYYNEHFKYPHSHVNELP